MVVDVPVRWVKTKVDRGRQYSRRVYTLICACGCGTEFEHPYVKKFVDRKHWYAFKRGKSIDELYGDAIANLTRRKLSILSRGKPSPRRGKTDVEVSGLEKARQKAQKLSAVATERLETGVIGPHSSKLEWVFNPFTQQQEFMHSSWETAFLKQMIVDGIPVSKKHDIRIKYDTGDGVLRTYTPDFIQLNAHVVYEIKGHMTAKDAHKIAALKAWAEQSGYDVQIVDKKPPID